jgi:hypothetical protein
LIFSSKLAESVLPTVETNSGVEDSFIGIIFSISSVSQVAFDTALKFNFVVSSPLAQFTQMSTTSQENSTFTCSQFFIKTSFCLSFKVRFVALILTVKLESFHVLLKTIGAKTILSFDPKNLGIFSFITTCLVVIIVVSQTQNLFSGVFTTLSIFHVVRLSGNILVTIFVSQFLSVKKSACQKAVSLKIHLFFFASHHFCQSQAHHFAQSLISFISNFSIKFIKDK